MGSRGRPPEWSLVTDDSRKYRCSRQIHERLLDIDTIRQTDRQTDRQVDSRQTGRQTDRQKDR